MSKPAEELIFEMLAAVATIAQREYEEMVRTPWYFFWKKGDAIARAKAWNEAWGLILDKIAERESE